MKYQTCSSRSLKVFAFHCASFPFFFLYKHAFYGHVWLLCLLLVSCSILHMKRHSKNAHLKTFRFSHSAAHVPCFSPSRFYFLFVPVYHKVYNVVSICHSRLASLFLLDSTVMLREERWGENSSDKMNTNNMNEMKIYIFDNKMKQKRTKTTPKGKNRQAIDRRAPGTNNKQQAMFSNKHKNTSGG